MSNKIEIVTIETTTADNNRIDGGTYRVEMPTDYDPSEITGEDILLDGALTIVDDE